MTSQMKLFVLCILVFLLKLEDVGAENYEDKEWEQDNRVIAHSMPKITNLEVKCGKKHMTVHMSFSGYFNGIVYSKGGYSQQKCAYVHPNSNAKSVHFDIYYDSCGTNSDLHGQYFENTVIIQYQPDIIEAWDEARKIKCEWHDYYEKSAIKPSIKVADLEVVQQEFMGDKIGCWLEIQAGKGPWAKQVSGMVKIGQHMTMVVAVTDEYGQFDMRVKSCFAHDGSRFKRPLYLTDEHGCSLRPKLISPFKKVKVDEGRATVISYAYFSAFKFPDKVDVQIECKVEVCRYGCPEHCENSEYKKSKENYHPHHEKVVDVNYPPTPEFRKPHEDGHYEQSQGSIKTENHLPHENDITGHSENPHIQQADVGVKIHFDQPKQTPVHETSNHVVHEEHIVDEKLPQLEIQNSPNYVPHKNDQPLIVESQVNKPHEHHTPVEQDYVQETEPHPLHEIVREQPIHSEEQHNSPLPAENYDQQHHEINRPHQRPHHGQTPPLNDHHEVPHENVPIQEHNLENQHHPPIQRPEQHRPPLHRPEGQRHPLIDRPNDNHRRPPFLRPPRNHNPRLPPNHSRPRPHRPPHHRPSHDELRRRRLHRPGGRGNKLFHPNPRFPNQERRRALHPRVNRPNRRNEKRKAPPLNFEKAKRPTVFSESVNNDYPHNSKKESSKHQNFVHTLELPPQPPAEYAQRPPNEKGHNDPKPVIYDVPKGPRLIHKRSADQDTAPQQLTVVGVSKAFQVLSENDIVDDSNIFIVPEPQVFHKFRQEDGVCLPFAGFITGTVLLIILIIISVTTTAVLYHKMPIVSQSDAKMRNKVFHHIDHYTLKSMSKRAI